MLIVSFFIKSFSKVVSFTSKNSELGAMSEKIYWHFVLLSLYLECFINSQYMTVYTEIWKCQIKIYLKAKYCETSNIISTWDHTATCKDRLFSEQITECTMIQQYMQKNVCIGGLPTCDIGRKKKVAQSYPTLWHRRRLLYKVSYQGSAIGRKAGSKFWTL